MAGDAGREDRMTVRSALTGYHDVTGGKYWPHKTGITGSDGVSTGSGARDTRIYFFKLRQSDTNVA